MRCSRALGSLSIVSLAAAGVLTGCGGGASATADLAVPAAMRDLCLKQILSPTVGVSGAGRAVSAARNHMVVLSNIGKDSSWTGSVPVGWRPAALADTELVACISDNSPEDFEVCTYTQGGTVTRVRYKVYGSVYEAATGREILVEGLPVLAVHGADPPPCPQTKEASLTRLEGERIEWPAVQSHLESLVAGQAIGMVTLTLTGGPNAGTYSLPEPSCSLGLHQPGVWQLEALDDEVKQGLSYFFFVANDGPGFTTLTSLLTDATMASKVTIGPWRKGTDYEVVVAKTAGATAGRGEFSVDLKGETASFAFTGEDASGVGIAWNVFCPSVTRR